MSSTVCGAEKVSGVFSPQEAGRVRGLLSLLRALSASTSRSLGGAVVTSASRSRAVTSATSSTAVSNAAWFAADGFVMPLTFRTYWRAAARTSSGVAGGAKLFSGRMLRHMAPRYAAVPPPATVHHQPFGRPSALGEQAD